MNKHIEKSLINKEIDTNILNPAIISNAQNKEIQSSIISELKSCDSFNIAVSYIKYSGLQTLIEALNCVPYKSRLLTTTIGEVTDPESLYRLLEFDNIDVRVYEPSNYKKGFHMKTYMFNKNEIKNLIIGSANISNTAFARSYEMDVFISSNQNGELVSQYENNFEHLWGEGEILTRELIQRYENRYYKKKQAEKRINEILNDTNEITPNQMQIDALEGLDELRSQGEKEALLIAATGSGKTYLSAFDVRAVDAKKVLFVVHNHLIINAAIKTFETIFGENTCFKLNSKNAELARNFRFVFTTPQGANSNLDLFGEKYFDYIIFDEAHRIAAPGQMAISKFFNPKFKLGMTATPERMDAGDVFAEFNYNVASEIRLHDALEAELIAPFNYYGYGVDTEEDNTSIIDYLNPIGAAQLVKSKLLDKGHFGKKLKAITFVRTIKEAMEMEFAFKSIGIESQAIHSGEGSIDDVATVAIKRLQDDNDSLEMLITINKFNEGIDIPDINTIIMMRRTESSIIFTQELGRGLRKNDPDKFLTVYDFVGNFKNNFLLIQALTGKRTLDVDSLKMAVANDFRHMTPIINIEFDEVAKEKIFKALDKTASQKNVVQREALLLYDTLGRIPTIMEYAESEYTQDLISSLQSSKIYSYIDIMEKAYKKENIKFTNEQKQVVSLIQDMHITFNNHSIYEALKKLLNGNKVTYTNEYYQRILIRDVKTRVKNDYFKNKSGFLVLTKEAKLILSDVNVKKLVYETIEYALSNEKLALKIGNKYRRQDFLYAFNSNGIQGQITGQMEFENEFVGTLNIKRLSDDKLTYGNDLISTKVVRYVTKEKNYKQAKGIINGDKPFKLFMRQSNESLSSADKRSYYLGEAKNIEVIKDLKNGSFILNVTLKNEIPLYVFEDLKGINRN